MVILFILLWYTAYVSYYILITLVLPFYKYVANIHLQLARKKRVEYGCCRKLQYFFGQLYLNCGKREEIRIKVNYCIMTAPHSNSKASRNNNNKGVWFTAMKNYFHTVEIVYKLKIYIKHKRLFECSKTFCIFKTVIITFKMIMLKLGEKRH